MSCLPSIKVQISASQEQQDEVTSNESAQDAQISPSVTKFQAELLVKLVAVFESTILAHFGCVVDEISGTASLEESRHVFSTAHAGRRSEPVQLRWTTDNVSAMQFSNNHATNQTCERIELIQPRTPETRNLWSGNGDTAEE